MSEIVLNSKSASKNNSILNGIAAALWACQDCQVWWGSQNENSNGNAEDARYLLLLVQPHTTLFDWTDFRGWRNRTAEANLCPQCDHPATTPRFTLWQ